MAFQPIKLGEKIKSVAMERYKAQEGNRDVISVVSRKIAGVNMHFAPGMGFVYCFKGACCQELGLPSQRYILPIVRYTIENLKARKYGMPVFMEYYAMSLKAYTSEIETLEMVHTDMTKRDLIVTCEEQQYQKNKIQDFGEAVWRKDEIIFNTVKELFAEYTALIEMSVARTLTEEVFLKALAATGGENVPDHNQRNPAPRSSLSSSGRARLTMGGGGKPPPAQAAEELPTDQSLLMDDPPQKPATVAAKPARTVDVAPAKTVAAPPTGAITGAAAKEKVLDADFSELMSEEL